MPTGLVGSEMCIRDRIRTCVLFAMVIAPLLGGLLDSLLPDTLTFAGATIVLTDERLALMTGGVIVVIGGVIAAMSLRAGQQEHDARGVAT